MVNVGISLQVIEYIDKIVTSLTLAKPRHRHDSTYSTFRKG